MNKQISASGLMDELPRARTRKKEFWGADGAPDSMGNMNGRIRPMKQNIMRKVTEKLSIRRRYGKYSDSRG
jgi:hypothetical protein